VTGSRRARGGALRKLQHHRLTDDPRTHAAAYAAGVRVLVPPQTACRCKEGRPSSSGKMVPTPTAS